jgi:hypothetical protein
MRALATFLIYVTPFLTIGFVARRLLRERHVELSDVQAQAGENRPPRRLFLLGVWRTES